MTTTGTVPLSLALQAFDAGLCVVPPKQDGTKAPDPEWVTLKKLTPLLGEVVARKVLGKDKHGVQVTEGWRWGHWQYMKPHRDAVTGWYEEGRDGLGVACGVVSGWPSTTPDGQDFIHGLEAGDIDAHDIYALVKARAVTVGLGDLIERLERGYCDRTPNGARWLWYCQHIEGNLKLAERPIGENERKTLIETRGQGGYIILRGSGGRVHDTGKSYDAVSGSFESIVTITPAERSELLRLLRSFDEMTPPAASKKPNGRKVTATNKRPGDTFNERATWEEILEPAGWVKLYERDGEAGWRRPGKAIGLSATTNHKGTDTLHVFSTSTPFNKTSPSSYDKFGTYAVLYHGGDLGAAASALAGENPATIDLSGVGDDGRLAGEPQPEAPTFFPRTLNEVIATFNKWLYLEDPGLIQVTLATVAANYMRGDPLWLMYVGASSGGKTETLNSLAHLPHVHMAATMTEGSLLSGTPKKDKTNGAKGGLLREIGDFGLLLCKDFTSILSMNRDPRALLLAALREVYDGSWTRHVGVDGGRTLAWEGKVGLIAGCTAAIDSHHAVMATMGERFLLWRLPDVNPRKQARKALANTGKEHQLRQELSAVVGGFFAGLTLPDEPPELDTDVVDQLIALASLVARARSAVERDGRTREIELILDPEAPARIAQALRRLYGGLVTIGLDSETAWALTRKTGFDCMPKIRRCVFNVLAETEDWSETPAIAAAVGYPTLTARRALEDLTVHQVVTRRTAPKGKSDTWQLSKWARRQYRWATESEKSVDDSEETGTAAGDGQALNSPHSVYDDFSDSVATNQSEPAETADAATDRESVCWQCRGPLRTDADIVCEACGWMRCACGACREGCAADSDRERWEL